MKIGLRQLAGPLITIAGSGYTASYAVWQDASGDTVTGLHTGWGDLLVHIRAVTFFAHQGGWPHESFLLAGQPIGYSFFADLLSSWLWQAGVPISTALAAPTIILVMIFFALLAYLTWHLTQSWAAASIAPLLFLGFGGLSGFYTLPEFFQSTTTWQLTLRNLPHEVTAWHDLNMVILNPFIMMLHQRAYLLGFPLFLLFIYFLWQTLVIPTPSNLLYVMPDLTLRHVRRDAIRHPDSGFRLGDRNDKQNKSSGVDISKSFYALAATNIIGLLLAFTHPFTWIVTLMIWPSWIIWLTILGIKKFTRREYILFAAGFLIMAVGGYAIIHSLQPRASSSFISWHPGWLDPTVSWPLFWLKNIGLFAPLTLLSAWHLWRTNRALLALLLATGTPFIAGNLVQFAPWAWDNTKIFAPIWIIISIVSANLLASWWTRWQWQGKVAVIVIIPLAVFSGGLEITRALVHNDNPLTLSTPTDEALGQAVQNISTPSDILLTAPTPNHPVFMYAGLPSFVAYEGWLWSQGWQGIYESRIADMRAIYQGGPAAKALLQKNAISLVVIGPPELQLGANQVWFDQNYPLVLNMNGYRVYRVRQ